MSRSLPAFQIWPLTVHCVRRPPHVDPVLRQDFCRVVAVQNPGAKPGQEAQEAASRQVQVPLDTEQLVHALNEHVRGAMGQDSASRTRGRRDACSLNMMCRVATRCNDWSSAGVDGACSTLVHDAHRGKRLCTLHTELAQHLAVSCHKHMTSNAHDGSAPSHAVSCNFLFR